MGLGREMPHLGRATHRSTDGIFQMTPFQATMGYPLLPAALQGRASAAAVWHPNVKDAASVETLRQIYIPSQ